MTQNPTQEEPQQDGLTDESSNRHLEHLVRQHQIDPCLEYECETINNCVFRKNDNMHKCFKFAVLPNDLAKLQVNKIKEINQ